MRFIDSKSHGVLDYLSGILLVGSPWIFGFDHHKSAMWIMGVVGTMIIIMSLLTKYELAAARIVPLKSHLVADVLVGVVLIFPPWIFGFEEDIKWPHSAFGFMM